jgi:signal peptidase I
VLFSITKRPLPVGFGRKETTAIKRIACGEGRLLTVEGLYFYCGGRFLGAAKTTTSTGAAITPFTYNGLVPNGSYFVMGDNKNSYDSRYWGFLKKEAIIARAYPIF